MGSAPVPNAAASAYPTAASYASGRPSSHSALTRPSPVDTKTPRCIRDRDGNEPVLADVDPVGPARQEPLGGPQPHLGSPDVHHQAFGVPRPDRHMALRLRTADPPHLGPRHPVAVHDERARLVVEFDGDRPEQRVLGGRVGVRLHRPFLALVRVRHPVHCRAPPAPQDQRNGSACRAVSGPVPSPAVHQTPSLWRARRQPPSGALWNSQS